MCVGFVCPCGGFMVIFHPLLVILCFIVVILYCFVCLCVGLFHCSPFVSLYANYCVSCGVSVITVCPFGHFVFILWTFELACACVGWQRRNCFLWACPLLKQTKKQCDIYHGGQVDVGQAVDQGLTQAGELQEQGLVPLLNLFVLLLHALEVLLHWRDLSRERHRTALKHICPLSTLFHASDSDHVWFVDKLLVV